MKVYQRLLVVTLLSILISCLISPFIAYGMELLQKVFPGAADALDHPFHRIMSRVVLVVTLLLLFRERRRLEIRSLASMGFSRGADWKRLFWKGWLLGLCSLSLLIIIMILGGARRPEAVWPSGAGLIYEIIKAFLTGVVVALIEETFFRGFVLHAFLKDTRRLTALVATSAVFAIVHFFKAKGMPEPIGLDPAAGFRALAFFFKPLLSPVEVIPGFIGLFLAGVVLALVCLRTRSLYLAIGIHAGWVFIIKMNGVLLDRVKSVAPWFFGDSSVVTGILGWLMLLLLIGGIPRLVSEKHGEITKQENTP